MAGVLTLRRREDTRSLPEVHGTILASRSRNPWRRLLSFMGPGYLVAVGYMDPGNWATDLAGGSAFGYTLLSVILISNLMAILLQSLAARLGIAAGLDLAQACRAYYSRPVNLALWALCEVAIIACDLAEVIGTAIALQLLFGIPLVLGAALTALDVMLILLLQQRGFRYLEAFIISLMTVIAVCFAIELAIAQPDWLGVAGGFVPSPEIIANPAMLYIAIGILGATVMQHNLYLHSSIVQTRRWEPTRRGRRIRGVHAITRAVRARSFCRRAAMNSATACPTSRSQISCSSRSRSPSPISMLCPKSGYPSSPGCCRSFMTLRRASASCRQQGRMSDGLASSPWTPRQTC